MRLPWFDQNVTARHKTFITTMTKWILWGSIIGIVVGSTSALLINTNDFLTEIRQQNPFLILFLPIGGIVIGYVYMFYGKGSRKGNDLILGHIHHGQGRVPLRMGPIVFLCTFITHLLGGSSFIFSGHHGIYGAQKVFDPKSRLLGLPSGETITNIERKKGKLK